jgi:hypothetical protein
MFSQQLIMVTAKQKARHSVLLCIPEFFTNDCHEAFRFKDREQAESFVAEFADALLNPQVLDHP